MELPAERLVLRLAVQLVEPAALLVGRMPVWEPVGLPAGPPEELPEELPMGLLEELPVL
jgi:hypothetical protein